MRGLSTEGNLRFKIDQASLILERKFTVFLRFTLFKGNFQVQAPGGGGGGRLSLEGRLNGEVFGGPTFGGAYTWRGSFSKFYGIVILKTILMKFATQRSSSGGRGVA